MSNENTQPLSPQEEKKQEKKLRKKQEREERQAKIKRDRELASLPLIKRLFKKKRNFMIALCVVLGALCILAASFIVSPGTFKGSSYSFFSYGKYVELPNTSEYTYDAGTKADKAKEDLYNKFLAEAELKKVPKKQVENERKIIERQYETIADNYALSYDNLIDSLGYNQHDWNKQLKTASKEAASWKLACHAYARKHHVELTSAGYKSFKNQQFKSFGITKKSFEKVYHMSYNEYCKKNDFYSDYVRSEVQNDLYKNAKAKAVKKKK